MQYYSVQYPSPIGMLTIISDGVSIISLRMETQPPLHLPQLLPGRSDPVLAKAVAWLDDYFAGKMPSTEALPLNAAGTAFQCAVWERLLRIPYGQTVTYGQIAAQIALDRGIKKMSAQAVGQAVGANPISIMIPCHRVMGANGNIPVTPVESARKGGY